MNPLVQALFSPWEWRLDILLVLLPLGMLYTLGWRRIRRHCSGQSKLATAPRLAAYWLGLLVLMISLMSPIDLLGGQLFFMHMVQHMLSISVAVPLLLLANPFPFLIWGLPAQLRPVVGGLFVRESRFRRLLRSATQPVVAWLTFITVYLGWHEPALYNMAQRRNGVHDLEHITFFLAAMLYWWHVIGAAPRIHRRFPVWARMAYLIGTVPFNMAAGVTIAFSTTVLYSYYESVPRLWGYTALQDQMISGVIMWIPGSMMYLMAAIVVLALWARDQKTRPSQPRRRLVGDATRTIDTTPDGLRPGATP